MKKLMMVLGAGVATNGVIEVPAEGKSGFFYLMSKPAVPSDSEPHVPAPHLGPAQ